MSKYSERLATLKREIAEIKSKKKKKFKKHQQEMINFIHSIQKEVNILVYGKNVILRMGDSNKGFKHILESHYKKGDLETMDILNLPVLFKSAIKLTQDGVSNQALTVYKSYEKQKEHKLIVNELNKDELVVTAYRKS